MAETHPTLPFTPRIIDGGTGTELERLGVPMSSSAWSGEAVLSHPQVLRDVHQSFLDAGADLIIANTFAAALHNLESADLADKFEQINTDAMHIVKEVIAASGKPCIAASGISTSTFSGSLDYSRLPSGNEAIAYYARQAAIQTKAGSELIILEMMRDIEQTTYALHGALQSGGPIWVGFSCFVGKNDTVFLLDTDIPLAQALAEIPLELAHGVGIMHTLIEHTPAALSLLKESWDGFTFTYPHAGHFIMPNWQFEDAITPEDFAKVGQKLAELGADAIGGCCGISARHIKELHAVLRKS